MDALPDTHTPARALAEPGRVGTYHLLCGQSSRPVPLPDGVVRLLEEYHRDAERGLGPAVDALLAGDPLDSATAGWAWAAQHFSGIMDRIRWELGDAGHQAEAARLAAESADVRQRLAEWVANGGGE